MTDSKFLISEPDWIKIHQYASCAYHLSPDWLDDKEKKKTPWKNEIGGMAVIVPDGDNWLIKDPTILKQEVHGTVCILDKEALAEYFGEMLSKHGPCRYLWWHSHHMMSANWSGTDENTIGETRASDWTASLLINLKGDHKLRVQYFKPIEASVDVEVEVIGQAKNQIPRDIIEEVFEKCEEKSTAVTTYGNVRHYGGYNYNGQSTLWEHIGKNSASKIDVHEGYRHNAFHYGDDTSIDDDFVASYIDDLNEKYIKMEINYAKWRDCVRESNKELRKHGVKIIEYKRKKLDEIVYTAEGPEAFISYDIGGKA